MSWVIIVLPSGDPSPPERPRIVEKMRPFVFSDLRHWLVCLFLALVRALLASLHFVISQPH
ncbi:hypothetical protein ACQKP8_06530 [Photobacterium alginatilyticum]|uniref:hypothetical protein n=1 Tax=Photobacterium alginatilyticum TaxID=1775171 RepID=UPI0040697BF5